ncbi:MAG: flagellar export protein FliJ [Desulfobacteraceae bacterium]|nr:flagellar export protein FliJ [Desulfobacteraceae bacterium]
MAYHYRLETLLTVRRNFEEQAKQRLARELFVLENHQLHLRELVERRLALCAAFEERQQQTISAPMFGFYVEAIHLKNREIVFQNQAVLAQQELIEGARAELLARVRARQVVERLREKDFLRWRQEVAKKEQVEGDEQVMMRFGREERR